MPSTDKVETTSQGVRPLVSVVVPVRNEAGFIANLVGSILNQDYPRDRIEVIVADGRSTDGTREILATLQPGDSRLIVIDNPQRIVSTGLNLAIAQARGEVIVRIDGHALIAEDFLARNVDLLEAHPEAWSVGGPIRHAATSSFGRAVSIAMSHPVGVGNASHRYPDYEGYVEGAQFLAFRRWVFDRAGTFDERLVRNQDDEFNYRIRQAGGRVYVSPSVRYSYFVRERPQLLFKQYFQYGFWRIPVIVKHRRPTTLRQVMPTAFYVACLLLAVLAWMAGRPLVALALPALYVSALLWVAGTTVRSNGWRTAACVPLAVALMHAGYGFGVGYGLLARIFRVEAWNPQGRMAAISR
jgi:glycosyltransferase involved in cell wall biosynthesis